MLHMMAFDQFCQGMESGLLQTATCSQTVTTAHKNRRLLPIKSEVRTDTIQGGPSLLACTEPGHFDQLGWTLC